MLIPSTSSVVVIPRSIDLPNSDEDIVPRIAFQRGTNKILFNTHRAETSNCDERAEHVRFEGKFIGRDTTITICDHRSLACGLFGADWASDESDCKSVSGYCFYFLDSLVSWSFRKQRTVSTSSTESEYYVLANTIKEAIWIRLFLSLMKIPSLKPFPDNQSAQTIAMTGAISSWTKHIDVRHHFIQQHINDGTFDVI